MTAVLSATDVLRRDRAISSHGDEQLNYPASHNHVDWKEKYYEVADMLTETRAELDEFQHSSKELEEELERELERTEKAHNELRVRVTRTESERDEWKTKFMTLQTTHNTTTTSLQRELDTLRQEHQHLKVQLRELELGNDDLERNERAVSSSLADVEAKYSRALEEKILLEHELIDKANVEEESQRLKDELRDANTEITVLKDQLNSAQNRISYAESSSGTTSQCLLPHMAVSGDEIMKTSPPNDLLVSDLGATSSDTDAASTSSCQSNNITPRQQRTVDMISGPPAIVKRSGLLSSTKLGSPTASFLARSSTAPSLSPSRLPSPRTPLARPPTLLRNIAESLSGSTSSSLTGTATKSRPVQMVSEMRSRVRNLEQKLHDRVPRLRMSSITGKSAANPMSCSTLPPIDTTRLNGRRQDPRESKKADRKNEKPKANGDTSGWVLIMEDPASPAVEKDRRRASSPSSQFQSSASSNPHDDHTRRPQSRLSISTDGRTSTSTTATASSIPTPSSRPATPTFLPVPTQSIYSNGLSKWPSGGPQKRSSLGSTTPPSSLPIPQESYPRPLSVQSSLPPVSISKHLPHATGGGNVRTGRGTVSSATANLLAQSRIGRPVSLGHNNGRRSAGHESDDSSLRNRAGSTSALGRRVT